ncbi:DUF952 domain-containing protein [Streptomyces anandii]|uniref:DUF952 domain-containing protein n=1 Tax=Streptomyces anandii TaxID=285454 RepID=UPI001676133F|nr:DUF952 domain-containing protein [Streptomyces anandii]GGX61235.1 hypothetical protein GCM10010510_01950 [Streptomyces anandii JCM 4720]
MIYHVVPLAEWTATPDRPYAPASLADDGFVHCSPDEPTTLAVVNAFYRTAPRPLLALVLDETRLTAPLKWEPATPTPPPGVPAGTPFPHLYGPLDRDAVTSIQEIHFDQNNQATGLRDTPPGKVGCRLVPGA